METGRLTRIDKFITRSHIFRVDNHGEEGMDLLLEFGDGRGELSNEGVVEEYEIGEEVMTNEDAGFGRQSFCEAG